MLPVAGEEPGKGLRVQQGCVFVRMLSSLLTLPMLHVLQEQLVKALHGDWPEMRPGAGPQRYGQHVSHWVPVDPKMSLREVLLQPDHVVPGLPLFWVLAKGTDYRQRFLAEELKRF
jgi:hypothetical protein